MHDSSPSECSAREKSTDELLAILAHDIRNPLAAVVNGVQILRQMGTTGTIAEQTLDLIDRQLKHVIKLVGEILQPAQRPQETTNGAATIMPPVAGPLRLLVVEDNRDVAKSLTSMLRLWGHEVYVAYDGLKALAAANQNSPQVVLLDLDLPDLDGYAVARRLKESSQSAPARLIAVTASGDEDHRQRSRAARFDLHLVKPVEPALLKQILASLSVEVGG